MLKQEKTSQTLRAVGDLKPEQAIESDVLFNYHLREQFEVKFTKLLEDSELILGTKTRGIDIIAMRFLEHWKYEPILVLIKFIDELTKGVFSKVHKNVLDLPTLNKFYAEFKGPYIEALERRHRALDKDNEIDIDYEAYKERMKNYKGEKYEQAKRLSNYLESRGKKGLLSDKGNIRNISDKPAQDTPANKGTEDSTPEDTN